MEDECPLGCTLYVSLIDVDNRMLVFNDGDDSQNDDAECALMWGQPKVAWKQRKGQERRWQQLWGGYETEDGALGLRGMGIIQPIMRGASSHVQFLTSRIGHHYDHLYIVVVILFPP